VVVASVAVAKTSVGNVVLLHALAYNAGRSGGIPASQIPQSARTVLAAFNAEIAASTRLAPPAGSSAATFVSALRSYARLAGVLARRDASSHQLMPASYWVDMKAADAAWLKALADLGHASGQNLTSGMAPLLYGSR
jgi:hypothetical protein